MAAGSPQLGAWLALALEPRFALAGLEPAVPWTLVVAEVEEEERPHPLGSVEAGPFPVTFGPDISSQPGGSPPSAP